MNGENLKILCLEHEPDERDSFTISRFRRFWKTAEKTLFTEKMKQKTVFKEENVEREIYSAEEPVVISKRKFKEKKVKEKRLIVTTFDDSELEGFGWSSWSNSELVGFEKKGIGNENRADFYEFNVCAVCLEILNYEKKPKENFICSSCKICVHKSCYGIKKNTENNSNWICSKCTAEERPTRNSKSLDFCCLCLRKGGAMWKTNDKKWAHPSCAFWIPEIRPIEWNSEKLLDTNGLLEIRRHFRCEICERVSGATIQCSSCVASFHPICGLFQGYYMKVIKSSKKLVPIAMCKKHRPKKQSEIKKKVIKLMKNDRNNDRNNELNKILRDLRTKRQTINNIKSNSNENIKNIEMVEVENSKKLHLFKSEFLALSKTERNKSKEEIVKKTLSLKQRNPFKGRLRPKSVGFVKNGVKLNILTSSFNERNSGLKKQFLNKFSE